MNCKHKECLYWDCESENNCLSSIFFGVCPYKGLFINITDSLNKQREKAKINEEKPDKADKNKIKAGVLTDFSLALKAVAEVGSFGVEKYVRGGYFKVENAEERYKDAFWRHLLEMESGTNDEESGFPHEWHMVWCALLNLELKLRRAVSEGHDHFNAKIHGPVQGK